MATMRAATPDEVKYFDALGAFQKEHDLTNAETMRLQQAGLLNPTTNTYPDINAVIEAKGQTKVEEAQKNKAATKDAYKVDFTNSTETGMTGAERDRAWARHVPDSMKPTIVKNDKGEEVIAMPGKFLTRFMKDLYTAGEENARGAMALEQKQAQASQQTQASFVPTPQKDIDALFAPTQVPQQVQITEEGTQEETDIMKMLIARYPGRTPDELRKLLKGN